MCLVFFPFSRVGLTRRILVFKFCDQKGLFFVHGFSTLEIHDSSRPRRAAPAGASADVGGEQYGAFFGYYLDTGRVGGDEDCLAPAYALGVAFGVLYGGFPGRAYEDEE